MVVLLAVTAGVFVPLAAAFILLFRKIVGQQSARQDSENWDGLFAPGRYHPLDRLLGGRDHAYVASLAGHRSLEKRFRAKRAEIVRGYVRCLRKDFMRVLAAIKVFMVHSPVDRPDLAPLILRHCIKFVITLLWVEFQLLLFRHGFGPVAVRSLLASVNAIYMELRVAALAAQSSTA